MLCAVFALVGCDWKDGCDVLWQEAALALEQAAREDSGLLGLGCDLDRTDAMSEAVHAGMNLPTDAVLRSLQLDICDLLKWRDFERRYDERQRRKW